MHRAYGAFYHAVFHRIKIRCYKITSSLWLYIKKVNKIVSKGVTLIDVVTTDFSLLNKKKGNKLRTLARYIFLSRTHVKNFVMFDMMVISVFAVNEVGLNHQPTNTSTH